MSGHATERERERHVYGEKEKRKWRPKEGYENGVAGCAHLSGQQMELYVKIPSRNERDVASAVLLFRAPNRQLKSVPSVPSSVVTPPILFVSALLSLPLPTDPGSRGAIGGWGRGSRSDKKVYYRGQQLRASFVHLARDSPAPRSVSPTLRVKGADSDAMALRFDPRRIPRQTIRHSRKGRWG